MTRSADARRRRDGSHHRRRRPARRLDDARVAAFVLGHGDGPPQAVRDDRFAYVSPSHQRNASNSSAASSVEWPHRPPESNGPPTLAGAELLREADRRPDALLAVPTPTAS